MAMTYQLNGATGQAELHGPDGAAPAPVIELLDGRNEDALLAQFDLQSFFNHVAPLQLSVISCQPSVPAILVATNLNF
jgi:hypothetical protein